MHVKSGAYEAAKNGLWILKAVRVLRAEGDAVGTNAADAAFAKMRKAHDAAYMEQMMAWARVGEAHVSQ